MSLLSWDDLADENENVAKAIQSVQQLDTTEAEKELAEQAEQYKQTQLLKDMGAIQPAPEKLITLDPLKPIKIDYAGAGEAMRKAKEAVESYMMNMEFGERVLAKDKRLINSKTDLNQLIPFKYMWAWSMYLESSAAHWMPTEAEGYMKDEKEYQTLLTSEKKLVSRLCVNYMYSQYIYTPVMLVNLYRLSTNPETRQYSLRQMFEEQVFHHSIRHIAETFDLGKDDIRLHHLDEVTFQDRNRGMVKYIDMMNDMSASTGTVKEMGDFIVALAVMYGGMRGLYHLVPLFQLTYFNRTTGKLSGVTQNVKWILRDMNRQLDFGIRYINGIIAENPDVLTHDVQERIRIALKALHTANDDLMSTLNSGNVSEIHEAMYCSEWFMNHFMSEIGIADVKHKPQKPEYEQFIQLFFSQGVDHGSAQVGIGGASGDGGALDWT